MSGTRPTLIRRFLLWYMQHPPFNPYVSYSFACDFTAAQAYLDRINATPDAPRVSVQHLLTGAIARVYAEFPVANAGVAGYDILRHEQVGVVVPVDLGDADRGELGVVLVERAQARPLREIARRMRRRVREERGGGAPQNAVFKRMMPLVEELPGPVLRGALSVVDGLSRRFSTVARALHRTFPMTIVVSNVGATVPAGPGVVGRAATAMLPGRFFGLGSTLGVFPLQDEVIPVDGVPAVRRMLPLVLIFDHRLFDGVMGGRIITRLTEILMAPDATFGPDAEAPGPDRVGA